MTEETRQKIKANILFFCWSAFFISFGLNLVVMYTLATIDTYANRKFGFWLGLFSGIAVSFIIQSIMMRAGIRKMKKRSEQARELIDRSGAAFTTAVKYQLSERPEIAEDYFKESTELLERARRVSDGLPEKPDGKTDQTTVGDSQ